MAGPRCSLNNISKPETENEKVYYSRKPYGLIKLEVNLAVQKTASKFRYQSHNKKKVV